MGLESHSTILKKGVVVEGMNRSVWGREAETNVVRPGAGSEIFKSNVRSCQELLKLEGNAFGCLLFY